MRDKSLFQIDTVEDVKRWSVWVEEDGGVRTEPPARMKRAQFTKSLHNTNGHLARQVLEIVLDGSGFRAQLIPDCAVGTRHHFLEMRFVRYLGRAVRAVVFYGARNGAGLKNNGQPCSHVNAKDMPSPCISSFTDCR